MSARQQRKAAASKSLHGSSEPQEFAVSVQLGATLLANRIAAIVNANITPFSDHSLDLFGQLKGALK
jgi:hypothetical protein